MYTCSLSILGASLLFLKDRGCDLIVQWSSPLSWRIGIWWPYPDGSCKITNPGFIFYFSIYKRVRRNGSYFFVRILVIGRLTDFKYTSIKLDRYIYWWRLTEPDRDWWSLNNHGAHGRLAWHNEGRRMRGREEGTLLIEPSPSFVRRVSPFELAYTTSLKLCCVCEKMSTDQAWLLLWKLYT